MRQICFTIILLLTARTLSWAAEDSKEQLSTLFYTVFKGEVYTVYLSGPKDQLYTLKYVPNATNQDSYCSTAVVALDRDVFEAAFTEVMNACSSHTTHPTIDDIHQIASELFEDIWTQETSRQIEQRLLAEKEKIDIGTIRLKHSTVRATKITRDSKKDTVRSVHIIPLNFISAEFAFEDGVIKDMQVRMQEGSERLFFRNENPISVSSPRAISIVNTLGENTISCSINDTVTVSIDLAALISIDRKVAFVSGTYHPENKVVTLSKDSVEVHLYKPSIAESFDIRVYTDVTGVQESNPNGLVQVEAKYPVLRNTGFSGSWVFLQSLSPFVTFSKIENKVSVLPLNHSIDEQDPAKSFSYASTFDLLRYANVHLGIDANIATSVSDGWRFQANVTAGLFRTTIDSTVKYTTGDSTARVVSDSRNINSYYFMPEVKLQFFTSDRIDFEVGVGAIFARLFDTTIKQTVEAPRSPFDPAIISSSIAWNNPISKFQGTVNLHPDPSDHSTAVFLRAVLVLDSGQNNVLFQIGYSTPIAKMFASGENAE